MAPLEGSVSPQEDGVAADHHVQASWVCLGSDLSADPAAVVRRGPHQSSAGQEGHSGELAALLLGRRQWETVGASSLPTHRGWFGDCVCPGGAVWSTTESQTCHSAKEPCGLTSAPRPAAAGTADHFQLDVGTGSSL